ncbi:hypothetical protein HK102_008456, partial [Quaeritorhiza haematococci]
LFRPSPAILKRAISYLVCLFVLLAQGSLFVFANYSEGLRTRFNYSAQSLNFIAFMINGASYLGYLVAGPTYDHFGVRATMVLSAVLGALGYFLIYGSYKGWIPNGESSVLMGIYFFLVGTSAAASFIATVGVIPINFTKNVGFLMGLLVLCYCIGAFPYSQIYTYYAPAGKEVDTAGYILFIGISVTIATVIGSALMFTVPGDKSEKHDVPTTSTSITHKQIDFEDDSKRTSSYMSDPHRTIDRDVKTVETSSIHKGVTVGGGTELGTSKIVSTPEPPGMTGKEMVQSMIFWLYAGIWLFQQGLMYFTNTGLVVSAARHSLGVPSNPDEVPAWLANQTAQHITMFSVAQGIACVVFGAAFDYVELPKKMNASSGSSSKELEGKKRHWKVPVDNSSLLFLDMAISIIPLIIIGFFDNIGPGMLLFCSFLVGVGWGAGYGLLTALTLDFFGQKAFGLAVALTQVLPPVGIFAWTQIFAVFYDNELSRQKQVYPDRGECLGSACYRTAFQISAGIQVICIGLCVVLWVKRTRDWRAMMRVDCTAPVDVE